MCTGSKHVEQCFNTWWFDGQWTEASVQKMGKFLLGSNGRQHVTVRGSTEDTTHCGLSAPARQLPSTTLTTKMPLRTSKVPSEEWQLIYERGSNVHRTWKGTWPCTWHTETHYSLLWWKVTHVAQMGNSDNQWKLEGRKHCLAFPPSLRQEDIKFPRIQWW